MIAKETRDKLFKLSNHLKNLAGNENDIREALTVTLFIDSKNKTDVLNEVFPMSSPSETKLFRNGGTVNEIIELNDKNSSYLNVVFAPMDDAICKKINNLLEQYYYKEENAETLAKIKIFIFFSEKTKVSEDKNFIQFEDENLIPVIEAYLTFITEPFLAQSTLIENEALCNFDENCLSCSEFAGKEHRKCRKYENHKRHEECYFYQKPPELIVRPYLPDVKSEVFIKGFGNQDKDNKKVYKAVENLFYSIYRFDPKIISKSISQYNEFVKSYAKNTFCGALQDIATCDNKNISFFTIDALFLNNEEQFAWFTNKNLIDILIESYITIKKINQDNKGHIIKISRILVVDFDRDTIETIIERLIPFYILSYTLGIESYICDKKVIKKDIQEYDLNFFLKSACNLDGKKLKAIDQSEILGIFDYKFPFARIYKKENKKILHDHYISCIEGIINKRIIEESSKQGERENKDCFLLSEESEFRTLIKEVGNEKEIVNKIFSENLLSQNNTIKEGKELDDGKENVNKEVKRLPDNVFKDDFWKRIGMPQRDGDSVEESIRKFLDKYVRKEDATAKKEDLGANATEIFEGLFTTGFSNWLNTIEKKDAKSLKNLLEEIYGKTRLSSHLKKTHKQEDGAKATSAKNDLNENRSLNELFQRIINRIVVLKKKKEDDPKINNISKVLTNELSNKSPKINIDTAALLYDFLKTK